MLGDVTGLELVAFVAESPINKANEAFSLSIIDTNSKAKLLEDIREYDENEEDEEDIRNHQIMTGITALVIVSVLFLLLSHAFIKLNSKHLPSIPEDQSLSIIGKILQVSLMDRVKIENMEPPVTRPMVMPQKEEAPPVQENIPIEEMTDEQLEEMLRKTNRELTSIESKIEDNIEFADYNR